MTHPSSQSELLLVVLLASQYFLSNLPLIANRNYCGLCSQQCILYVTRLEMLKGLIPTRLIEADAVEDNLVANVVGYSAHCGDYPHPFKEALDNLDYTESQLSVSFPVKPRSLEFTKFVMVNTLPIMQTMVKDLASSKEIAVDLEHHDRRTHLGLTCLIQVMLEQLNSALVS